jgi:glycosyltransferase involved in cell wall biosynthesis
MKIALVHEFLNQLGGAERVLENFLEIWPDATVHLLLYDEKRTKGVFRNYRKKLSFLDRMPFTQKYYKLYLALMPAAIESFRFDEYDVVLADSSAFAKGVRTNKLLICYCHTPTRYLWTDPGYLNDQPFPAILKLMAKPVMAWLKRWDYKAAWHVTYLIANSQNIRGKIKQFYDRDSDVIAPPVDTAFFTPTGNKAEYFFTASRLEPYKRMDIVVQAFTELGLPLKVAGSGTDLVKLKKIAGPNIDFLGWLADDELKKHYSEAQAFVFAAEEDAGIVILEAQACGTPVIAYGKGGALETVKPGVTGEFFMEQTPQAVKDVVRNFTSSKYDPAAIRKHALAYDKKEFQRKIKDFVEKKYSEFERERVDAFAKYSK